MAISACRWGASRSSTSSGWGSPSSSRPTGSSDCYGCSRRGSHVQPPCRRPRTSGRRSGFTAIRWWAECPRSWPPTRAVATRVPAATPARPGGRVSCGLHEVLGPDAPERAGRHPARGGRLARPQARVRAVRGRGEAAPGPARPRAARGGSRVPPASTQRGQRAAPRGRGEGHLPQGHSRRRRAGPRVPRDAGGDAFPVLDRPRTRRARPTGRPAGGTAAAPRRRAHRRRSGSSSTGSERAADPGRSTTW